MQNIATNGRLNPIYIISNGAVWIHTNTLAGFGNWTDTWGNAATGDMSLVNYMYYTMTNAFPSIYNYRWYSFSLRGEILVKWVIYSILTWYGFRFEEKKNDAQGYVATFSQAEIFKTPFYFVRKDWLSPELNVASALIGGWGHYWASSATAVRSAYSPGFNSVEFLPNLNESRYAGYSLSCRNSDEAKRKTVVSLVSSSGRVNLAHIYVQQMSELYILITSSRP